MPATTAVYWDVRLGDAIEQEFKPADQLWNRPILPHPASLRQRHGGHLHYSIRERAASSNCRSVSASDGEASPFSLRHEMVSNKALSSRASTSCNTPQSSTNNWPADTTTFRSAKCIQTCPFNC